MTIEFHAAVIPANSKQCTVKVEQVVGASDVNITRAAATPTVNSSIVSVLNGGGLSYTLHDVPIHNAYRVSLSECMPE